MLALVADNESEEKELIKLNRGSSALIIGYAEDFLDAYKRKNYR